MGIEINQKCNLHCTYCWNQKWNNREIDLKKTQMILNQVVESRNNWEIYQPINISIYAAEPLLSPDILFPLMDYPFYYQILTNGTLLKGEIAQELNYYPNATLIVSLDGIEINHNYFRSNSFDAVVDNIINYPKYSQITTAMTVNVKSLPYLYQSLAFMFDLPVSNFECHLNLYDNWTKDNFNSYINILINFINDYKDKNTLPGYELNKRFSNYANSKNYQKDRGGPLHQIDINNNIMVEKPHRSCIILPEKEDLFYGTVFANEKGFISKELQNKYNNFMEKGYSNYNFYSDYCNQCKFSDRCKENREKAIYLYEKECLPILESFILEEKFWK